MTTWWNSTREERPGEFIMKCDDFKKWFAEREFHGESLAAKAAAHMERCDACKSLYTVDSAIETGIRSGLRKVAPPERLLDRIEMNVQSSGDESFLARFKWKRISTPWRTAFAAPLAVAVMLLLVFTPFSGGFNSPEELGDLAVIDHMDNLAMAFTAGDIGDVPGWFEQKVGFKVHPPDMSSLGLRFKGGRKCHLGKTDVAYLFYDKNGERVSLFIINSEDCDFDMNDDEKYDLMLRGCKLRLWKEANLLYAMVE